MERPRQRAFTGHMHTIEQATTTEPTTETKPTGVPPDRPILVTGGTGKTGRRVAHRLTALGRNVRVASRSTTPAFDWDDPATWDPHLEDAAAAYIALAPDLSFPGAAEIIAAFSEAAVAHGVERLVLLSGRGEEGAHVSERIVAASGADWTVLRASWFAQNFSEHFLLGPVLDGVIALPAGTVAEPFVDADDVADVAVAALTEPGHAGRIYELTGPRSLTFDDVANELSDVIGRQVVYVSCSPAEYVDAAIAAGVPAEEAVPLADLFSNVLDGRNGQVQDGVRRALGRDALDFTQYVAATAATGVWNVGPAT